MSTTTGTITGFSHDYLEQWNSSARLEYAATHVFLPAQPEGLPSSNYTVENDHWLARAVYAAAHTYSQFIDDTFKPQWDSIVKMLAHLQVSVKSERLDGDHVISQLRGMQSGGTLTMFPQTTIY